MTQRRSETDAAVPIAGLAHIGIRVHELERALRFYELLGFSKTAGPLGPEPVAILEHPSGVVLNLILNASRASEPNVLMDLAEKHPGITHFALLCPDILARPIQCAPKACITSGGRFHPESCRLPVK